MVTGLFNSYSGAIFFLLGLLWFNGAVLLALCRWGSQWKGIRQATAQIVGGDPTVQIDTKHMYPDLAEHAGQLNDLGSASTTRWRSGCAASISRRSSSPTCPTT